jgi:hypothetical protein
VALEQLEYKVLLAAQELQASAQAGRLVQLALRDHPEARLEPQVFLETMGQQGQQA